MPYPARDLMEIGQLLHQPMASPNDHIFRNARIICILNEHAL
jgi:hypothetical protein